MLLIYLQGFHWYFCSELVTAGYVRCTCTRARGRRASLTCSSAIGRTRSSSRSQAGLNREKTRSSWALTPWPDTSGGRGTTPPSSIGATSCQKDHQRSQFAGFNFQNLYLWVAFIINFSIPRWYRTGWEHQDELEERRTSGRGRYLATSRCLKICLNLIAVSLSRSYNDFLKISTYLKIESGVENLSTLYRLFLSGLPYFLPNRKSFFFQPKLAAVPWNFTLFTRGSRWSIFILVLNCNCTLQFQVLAGGGDKRGSTGRREKNVIFRWFWS